MDQLIVAGFLALAANRITEAVVRPLKLKFPQLDFWWLLYPTWVLGGLLAWQAGVDVFAGYFPAGSLAGRVLTAVVVGGGSNLIADIFGARRVTLATGVIDEQRTG